MCPTVKLAGAFLGGEAMTVSAIASRSSSKYGLGRHVPDRAESRTGRAVAAVQRADLHPRRALRARLARRRPEAGAGRRAAAGRRSLRARRAPAGMLSGDHAWNVTALGPVAAPIALADRQFQFWSTPHGVIKAATANPAGVQ